jgi:thiamine-monophosphate kinase
MAASGEPAASSAADDVHSSWLRARFEYPTPRVALGEALRGVASACIDLSDGLLADLPRLAAASGCGAVLEVDRLPLSEALAAAAGEQAWQGALLGGEDYELCFTAPATAAPALAAIGARCGVGLTRCGWLLPSGGLELRRAGAVIQFSHSPFGHFAP